MSLGLPILLPDGTQIIRGPHISIPDGIEHSVRITEEDVDAWAQKGWVDLRPKNIAIWQERFRKMENSRQRIREYLRVQLGNYINDAMIRYASSDVGTVGYQI